MGETAQTAIGRRAVRVRPDSPGRQAVAKSAMLMAMPGEIKIGRQQLIGLLDPAYAADAACREALVLGANYRVYEGALALEETIRIYKQRAAVAESTTRASVGVSEALDRLGSSQLDQVLIGAVSGDREYTLFLSADATALIACLAF